MLPALLVDVARPKEVHLHSATLLSLQARVGQYRICDMQLLHESFNAIIAILHVKIEAQPHS